MPSVPVLNNVKNVITSQPMQRGRFYINDGENSYYQRRSSMIELKDESRRFDQPVIGHYQRAKSREPILNS